MIIVKYSLLEYSTLSPLKRAESYLSNYLKILIYNLIYIYLLNIIFLILQEWYIFFEKCIYENFLGFLRYFGQNVIFL